MEGDKDFSSDKDSDETLVTPRFDRDEAETARPVVPLAVVSGEAETYDAPAYDAAGAAVVPPRAARRASWPLALVLVSALAGGVLGGAGLYLFQKSRQQSAAPAQTEQPAGVSDAPAQTNAAPVSETTPTPAPEDAGALAVEPREEVAEVSAAVEVPDVKEEGKDREDADKKRDEPKRERDEDAAARPEKRGKKGEHDDNYEARASRPRRVRDDADDSPRYDGEGYYERGEARRIGSIVYGREGRRERRRQRRQPTVDRVRGIFEGQP